MSFVHEDPEFMFPTPLHGPVGYEEPLEEAGLSEQVRMHDLDRHACPTWDNGALPHHLGEVGARGC